MTLATLIISSVVLLLAAALIVVDGIEPPWSPVATPTTPAAAAVLPGCPSMCGNVKIPFPFGIGTECALERGFSVACNKSFDPPRAYNTDIEGRHSEIIDISVDAGEMRVFGIHASSCFNKSINDFEAEFVSGNFSPPFVISSTRNVFMAVGCDALAFLAGQPEGRQYFTGCITSCESLEDAAQDGDKCSGLGCCESSLPANLSTIQFSLRNWTQSNSWSYSPCSYVFLAQKDWYNFKRTDLVGRNFDRTIPLVLDWAIKGHGYCQKTLDGTWSAPACVSPHSTCFDVAQGNGYRCNCSTGYQGNPYLNGSAGCTDIDECRLRNFFPKEYEKIYPCGRGTICRNIEGGYRCQCKFGHVNDPKTEGDCRPIIPGYATAVLVAIVATLVLALLLYFLRKEHRRRVRRGFFDKNGGDILRGMNIQIFTELELEKITKHYSEFIGKGHFGKVYKGRITDENNMEQQVAVKCSIRGGDSKKKMNNQQKDDVSGQEFRDEIIFQFRISHANLVRLIGCCLETNVPCLVFEFVPNGSLYDVLHGDQMPRLSLMKRLDIAIGAAEAVSHMHSIGDHKHVYGDIKSANILLDKDLLPKVSDFGSSKLLSIDMYARAVAADRNYVDRCT